MSTHTLADATVKSMKTWARKAADFYPTPPDVTQALLAALGPQTRFLRIWEPACGRGDMAMVLSAAGHTVFASDLCFTGYGAGGINFLEAEPEIARRLELDAIISNPPFALAEEFIRQSVKMVPLVCMLLKSNYWHTQRGAQLFADHPPTMEYKLTWRPAFLAEERGNNPLMDCSWHVWRRGAKFTAGWRPVARPQSVPEIEPTEGVLQMERLGEALDRLAERIDNG